MEGCVTCTAYRCVIGVDGSIGLKGQSLLLGSLRLGLLGLHRGGSLLGPQHMHVIPQAVYLRLRHRPNVSAKHIQAS